MGYESANNIDELDDNWPLSDDLIPFADDHIRSIKSVLKNTFPGAGGNGFADPITATEAEINSLAGVTGDIQTQIDTEATTRADADSGLDARVTNLEAVNNPKLNDIFPVGAIYITAGNTNPGSLLGVGTWSARAQGRFIVGVGTGNDGAEGRAYGAGNSSTGSYRHQLTTAEMPAHTHSVLLGDSDNSGGVIEHGSSRGTSTDNTQSTGGDGLHENSPPAFGLYIWQRTA